MDNQAPLGGTPPIPESTPPMQPAEQKPAAETPETPKPTPPIAPQAGTAPSVTPPTAPQAEAVPSIPPPQPAAAPKSKILIYIVAGVITIAIIAIAAIFGGRFFKGALFPTELPPGEPADVIAKGIANLQYLKKFDYELDATVSAKSEQATLNGNFNVKGDGSLYPENPYLKGNGQFSLDINIPELVKTITRVQTPKTEVRAFLNNRIIAEERLLARDTETAETETEPAAEPAAGAVTVGPSVTITAPLTEADLNQKLKELCVKSQTLTGVPQKQLERDIEEFTKQASEQRIILQSCKELLAASAEEAPATAATGAPSEEAKIGKGGLEITAPGTVAPAPAAPEVPEEREEAPVAEVPAPAPAAPVPATPEMPKSLSASLNVSGNFEVSPGNPNFAVDLDANIKADEQMQKASGRVTWDKVACVIGLSSSGEGQLNTLIQQGIKGLEEECDEYSKKTKDPNRFENLKSVVAKFKKELAKPGLVNDIRQSNLFKDAEFIGTEKVFDVSSWHYKITITNEQSREELRSVIEKRAKPSESRKQQLQKVEETKSMTLELWISTQTREINQIAMFAETDSGTAAARFAIKDLEPRQIPKEELQAEKENICEVRKEYAMTEKCEKPEDTSLVKSILSPTATLQERFVYLPREEAFQAQFDDLLTRCKAAGGDELKRCKGELEALIEKADKESIILDKRDYAGEAVVEEAAKTEREAVKPEKEIAKREEAAKPAEIKIVEEVRPKEVTPVEKIAPLEGVTPKPPRETVTAEVAQERERATKNLIDREIIRGVESAGKVDYRLDKPVNRAEVVAIILRANNIEPKPTTRKSFTDSVDAWHTPYFETARTMGIVTGFVGERTKEGLVPVRPDKIISRAELVKMLIENCNKRNCMSETNLRDLREAITKAKQERKPWFDPFVKAALGFTTQEGKIVQLLSSLEATNPTAPLTKEEAAVIINRFIEGAGLMEAKTP